MHEIEQLPDGTAAFYSHRELAWHRLGTVTENALTLDEALIAAQLNWTVYKGENPVTFTPNYGHKPWEQSPISIDGHYPVYRDHPKLGISGLGIVGKQYTVVQNSEIGELAQLIVEESGGIWETMGSLYGGKKIFMSIKLPSTLDFGGEDPHELYLVLGSSHDGSMAVTAIITDVRVVCQNTWNQAIGVAKAKYVFKHTSGVSGKVAEAREALKLSYKYHEEFEKTMSKWLLSPVNIDSFHQITRAVIPNNPLMSSLQFNRVEQIISQITDIYLSPTQDFGRGSKYGVFNAFTEWDQWFRPVKGKDKDAARAAGTLFDTATKASARAFALLTSS